MECMRSCPLNTVRIHFNLNTRFLLAQLHMNTLIDQPTKGDIKEALQHLAKGIDGLDKTYKQAMKRIEGQGSRVQELAKHILGWIIHAKRPLSTTELQHALSIRPYTKKLNKDYLPNIQVLQSICAGLVTINEQSGIISLVHYTTQEYFKRTWTSWFPNAQIDITSICITYLLFNVFKTGFCQSDEEFEARLQTNVLYDYAARNWGHHAYTAPIKEDLILNLLKSGAKVSAASQAMMVSRSYSGYSQRVPKQITGVHIAAYFGLGGIIIRLLRDRYDPDLQDSYGWTPLSWAAERGHEAVVKLLLETGKVDVDSKDSNGRTPLSRAAEGGHEAVAKLLLETGKVDVDSKDSNGRTPLLRAAEGGHEAVVKLLLKTGKVDVDSKDSNNRTPLLRAAEGGHEAVVKLLLETGKVDVDSKDSNGRQTPLSWAAKRGHEAVVKLLLETGKVDVDSRDKYDRQTPLSWAAKRGHEAVVKLLLETGKVDVDSKDRCRRTPLSRAAKRGHEAVVKLLLDTGKVDVDSKTRYDCQTPLSWAAEGGHEAVVKLLLETGKVDVDSKDNNGRTPLSRAAKGGHEAVVKLLLETGKVDVDSKAS